MDPSDRLTKTKSRPPIPSEPERRILITGGAGFLGVNAAIHLIKGGWFVTLLDNLSRSGTERNLKWLITRYPNRTAFIKEDVRNAGALPEHVRDHDAILHLAGQVAVTTSLADPGTDFDVNARGTLNVLEAARLHNHDAPLVFASTNKVYGKLDHNNAACKETQPIDFHSPYGCSKGAADQYVRDYARCFGMNTVVLRQSCSTPLLAVRSIVVSAAFAASVSRIVTPALAAAFVFVKEVTRTVSAPSPTRVR